jgi:hephaestin
MVPDDPGTWLFHCHITFHNAAGMAMRYAVAAGSTVANRH